MWGIGNGNVTFAPSDYLVGISKPFWQIMSPIWYICTHMITILTLNLKSDWFLMFNATFSNVSAISWQPVLVMEEVGVPERITDHGPATGKLCHLRLRVEYTLFCNLQSRARTHAVLMIGLYELLGNPTT